MFRFAHPDFLYCLLFVPLFVALFLHSQHSRKKKFQALGDIKLLQQFMPNVSTVRPWVKFCLQTLAFIFIVLALARPQFGVKEQTVKREGIEVMFALDVSNSMLAQDVVPNRLERSKQVLSKLIDDMAEDKV